MYAGVVLEPDAGGETRRYVEQVTPLDTRFSISRWFRSLNPWALDVVFGTVFTIGGLLSVIAGGSDKIDYADPNAAAVLLALGFGVPFFWRRRHPFTTTVISETCLVLIACLQHPAGVMSQMFLVAAYTVGSWCEGWRRPVGFVLLVAAPLIVAAVGIPDSSSANLVLTAGIYAGSFFLGASMRNRRLYLQQLEERAEILERERDEEAKRAVADERLRIAQELHDVVAHSMGVIAVQAGVGAHVIDNDPAEAKKSLEAISTTSRTALTEIRRLLGVLREDEGASYTPAPGLADMERLVREICDAGVDTHVTWNGEREELPPGVDFTAYRIVQESLTNALKHGGPDVHVDVTLTYEPGVLDIEVVDDGRGVNGKATDGGHGLMGMRERVAVFGGSFQAGPVVGGGFRVAVRLPHGERA
jgi:signal transduction histidine kinase